MHASLMGIAVMRTAWCCAQTPALLPSPDWTDPKTAYPRYPQPELDNRYGIQLDKVYLQVLNACFGMSPSS